MNNQHAYVRYDSKGKIVSGTLIIREEPPKVGVWREVPIDLCCSPGPTPPSSPQTVAFTFDDIANVPVADVNSLSDWNTFLDFPNYGIPITNVSVVDNTVTLTGQSNAILKDSLFRRNTHIIDVTDTGMFRYISDFAFSNSALITGTFNDVVSAGYNAFSDYDGSGSSLTEITGAKFTTAGNYCFNGCTSLTTTGSVTIAGDYCFQGCTLLTSTGSVTTAGDYCFQGCTLLTTIENITTAGDSCFQNCTALTSTGSVTTAGDGCFAGCNLLTSIENITIAGNNCFYGCTSLISTGSVTTAGNNCFNGCTSLISTGSVTTAGDYCFNGCTLLTSTGSVTTAGYYCFENCTLLTSTGSVITAGDYCFSNCTSLTTIENVETAGYGCFENCTLLTSAGSVETAGDGCFAGCTSLTSTGSVITAGDSCFAGCTSLINIDLSNYIAPTIGNTTGEDNVFYGIAGNAVINLTVPSYLMTNNVGNPDGDIQYLIDNNTLVNITQV